MSIKESELLLSKPFADKKVYYSGSIRGVIYHESNIAWQLVQFMSLGGADVLSEHVAARTANEMAEIFIRRAGFDYRTVLQPHIKVRDQDLKWVDEATNFVALVDGPSHGVGIELEHALHKPLRGLNETPILSLVHQERLNNLSSMIRGISNPNFYLRTYRNLDEANRLVYNFLTGTLK